MKYNCLLVKDNNQLNLIITQPNSTLKEEIFQDVNIIKSSLNIIEIIKLLPWCNYISSCISNDELTKFNDNTYYDDFIKETNKSHHNNYPIVGKHNICKGLIRLTDITTQYKKQVILVDHNEPQQSVDGLEEAEVIEIVVITKLVHYQRIILLVFVI